MDSIAQLVDWNILRQVLFFLTTLVGAIISQMLSLHKNLEGCTPFLKRAWPKKTKRWYFLANSMILPMVGSVLAFVILEPESIKTSLCAGLTWCGTLQTLGISAEKDD